MAFGGEYRREHLDSIADFRSANGLVNGNGGAALPVNAGFDVYELFGEARVPLISDMPFAKDVSLELGYSSPTTLIGQYHHLQGRRRMGGDRRLPPAGRLQPRRSRPPARNESCRRGLDGTATRPLRPDFPLPQSAGRHLRQGLQPDHGHRPGPAILPNPPTSTKRPAGRQPQPAAGNQRHLYRGRLAADLLALGLSALPTLRHQDRQLYRQAGRQPDPQQLSSGPGPVVLQPGAPRRERFAVPVEPGLHPGHPAELNTGPLAPRAST